jgi:hypothetical protein
VVIEENPGAMVQQDLQVILDLVDVKAKTGVVDQQVLLDLPVHVVVMVKKVMMVVLDLLVQPVQQGKMEKKGKQENKV